jgi:hypothetical protein
MMKAYLESDYEKAKNSKDYAWFLRHGFKVDVKGAEAVENKKTGILTLKCAVDITPTEKMIRIEIPKGVSENWVRKMIGKYNRKRVKKNGKRTRKIHV